MRNEKVKNFIESLELPRHIAIVLFEVWEDCDFFIKNFYRSNTLVIDDLLDYRDYKIFQSEKSKETFLEECRKLGLRTTFESTFYQHFTNTEIQLVEEAISSKKTSLTKLFDNFKENPEKNILRYVL